MINSDLDVLHSVWFTMSIYEQHAYSQVQILHNKQIIKQIVRQAERT